ncbi:hypothetical protein ACQKLN_31310 [Paenibacillus glucanolyticus]|uniref:hypothetical protein n=1 Tax=Paenibacillus glucanolyticus TaxID=59843 RepID=UPI003D00B119
MSKAWEIAREGQVKFGGKVKEYFVEALKLAWAIIKKGVEAVEKVLIELNVNNRKGKTWVARITGTHPQYGFDREFVSSSYDDDGESGYRLAEGFYEVCEVGNRYFIEVANGDWNKVKKEAVLEYVK